MRIEFDVDVEDYDSNVVVDPTLFETVITNLLSNALKYTENGRIGLRLSYNTCAELVITDTGVGIASSDFDTVLDRFSRSGSGKTRAIEGTGIGLALVKEIVRFHGGEFKFNSKTQEEGGDDHGSTFTVRIPLSRPQSLANTPLDGTASSLRKRRCFVQRIWMSTRRSSLSILSSVRKTNICLTPPMCC